MLGKRRYSRIFGMLRAIVLVSLASGATAQELNNPRYPISEAGVANQVKDLGVDVDQSHVHLPAHMSAAEASPKLQIVAAQPSNDNQVRLELRCPTTSECLPFFATLDVEDAKAVSAAIQAKAASTNATSQTASRASSQADHDLRAPGASAKAERPRLTVGSQAVLEIREGHMDIHLQVLAIDSGSIGQQVRVSTVDRKKVFHATVTGEGTVTGVME